jgi:signal peptidase II
MKLLRVNKFAQVLTLIFGTVGCDQATKFVAKDNLREAGSMTFMGDVFRLEYAENTGAFLSLGAHLPEAVRFWIFIAFSGVFLWMIAFHIFSKDMSTLRMMGLSLMLGGGIGNLIDRILRGSVIDFMNMGLGSLRTGIFNVADVAIMAGLFILICETWIADSQKSQVKN